MSRCELTCSQPMIHVGMDAFCQTRLPMQDTNNAVAFHHISDVLLTCIALPSYLQRIRST